MRIYNKYVITLAITAALINSVLAFARQSDFEVYYAVNIIAYLIITLLYVHFNPRARLALNSVGGVLFGGFMVIVVLRVVEYLSGK